MNYLRMGRKEDMSSNRIAWTDQEKDAVAAEAFKLHLKNPKLSLAACVSKAQASVLPVSRHREHLQYRSIANWIEPLFSQMHAKAKKARADARSAAEALFDGPRAEAPAAAVTPAAADAAPTPLEDMPGTPEADNGPSMPASEPEQPPMPIGSENSEPGPTEVAVSAASSEPKRRQVHWTDAERKAVSARAHSNLKQWPDMSRLDAFRKAQDSELPADRRRTLNAWENLKDWAEPMLEALALDERIEEARIAEENERKREEARQRREADAAAARQREIEEQERQAAFERAVAERVSNLTFDELLHAIARRFGRAMYAGFSEGFGSGPPLMPEPPPAARYMPSPPAHRPEPQAQVEAPPARVKLPRVCIVGLLRQQEEDVEKAFRGAVDFLFIKTTKTGGNGEGGQAVEAKAWNCDLIIAMVDWCGHDVDKAAKKLGVPFVRLNGAASAVKREVRTWLDGREARKAA